MNVDLHTHILPGIDDGAKDTGTSLEMLNIARGDGTGQIVLTPHYIHGSVNNTADIVRKRCIELAGTAAKEGIGLELYPGSEVFLGPEIPELVKEGVICTLNDSMYVLVEFPVMGIPEYTPEILYQLKLAGYVPIIAHPERYEAVAKNPSVLYDYILRGVLCQMNSTSLLGLYGKKVRETALILLRHNMIHFISSDAHTCRGRAPRLQKARDMVAAISGENTAEKLFETNGRAVIENRVIEAPEPAKVSKISRWFQPSMKLMARIFS